MITKINFKYPSSYNYYLVDQIGSTNQFFKDNYMDYSDKSILIALSQTEGRGRYDRVWKSSNNDVIFSILLKHNNNYEIITPVAICQGLAKFNIKCGIKWPNDIYLNDKKLSGILIEDIFDSHFKASIIGIGINMTDKPSVYGVGLNIDSDRYDIINAIMEEFDKLINISKDDLIKLYKEYSIIIDRLVYYHNKLYTVSDIDLNGHLVLSRNGMKITVSSDEINIKESLR
ncbi:MAG: biotin--[Acholeplasmatales bacterium]|nr:biotin--[acetyl-CoA-carboxylase] ligase [Acholeplasmatales bacterium]